MTEAQVGPNLEYHLSFCIINRFWGGVSVTTRKDGKRYHLFIFFDTVACSGLDTMFTLVHIAYNHVINDL